MQNLDSAQIPCKIWILLKILRTQCAHARTILNVCGDAGGGGSQGEEGAGRVRQAGQGDREARLRPPLKALLILQPMLQP